MELRPALLLAGRTRFRPILMTSLAAILGLFPLALGIGPGAQMQQPLAIMVIGGLTANMLFTRAVIPAGYEVVERLFGRRAEGTPSRRRRVPSPHRRPPPPRRTSHRRPLPRSTAQPPRRILQRPKPPARRPLSNLKE